MDNSTGIADAADFKRAMESSNVERVALPASGPFYYPEIMHGRARLRAGGSD